MIVPVELALPCRIVRLDLRVGPEHGVTTLEDLVARGILAARDRVPDARGQLEEGTIKYLEWLFEVPERVIVDVISSLWNKGYVTVDFESGAVELSTEALAKLSRQESLAAEGEMQTREFLFEPITGMILPERLGRLQVGEDSVKLPLRSGVRESDIPQLELVRTVQSALRYERERSGRTNVLQVGFGSPALREPVRISWLPVRVAARRDPQTDRVSVTLDETLLWTSVAQQKLSDYLAKLADEEPDTPAVHQLKSRARMELEPGQRLEDLLRKMGEQTSGLEWIELSQVTERHRVLDREARLIRRRLTQMRNAQARASLVTRAAGHAWALEDLVEAARSQLVVVAPVLDYTRLRELLPGLRKALDRGVQLVVMWGRAPSDTLPERVGTLLDELELRPGSQVVRAPRSAQTEACVIIQDDCRALVGSHSVLGQQPLGAHEAAVLIEPADTGPSAPEAVTNLLRWARTEFPRWTLGQRIKLETEDAGIPGPVDHDSDSDETTGRPAMGLDPARVDEGTLQLWAAGWAEVYAALTETRAQIEAKAATVEVIQDGEHRTLLWQGLRGARRRLVIADDRIDVRTANTSLVRAARDRRAAGAVVQLVHPELPPSESSAESMMALRAGPNRIGVRLGRDSGRLMVADDEVLIGSFSPLRAAKVGAAGRRVSQLGLRIRDEALAADLALHLGAPAASVSEQASRPEAPARSRSAADAALPLLLETRTLARPGEFGRFAAERLKLVDEPFAVLAAWRDQHVPTAELRAVVAAALLAGLGTGPSADSWLQWLIEDAWRRNAFVAAAVLSQRLAGRPGALDGAATLAAALEIGPLGDVVVDAALALENLPGAQLAGAAGALADLLLWGGHESTEVLRLLAPGLPPNWRALSERGEKFTAAPLPLANLAASQTKADTLRDLDQRCRGLVTEIDKIEALRTRFDFDIGLALHGRLFVTGGLLFTIREAARVGIVACYQLAPELPQDVRQYLNRQIAEAGAEPMEWLKQVHFLHRIEDIVRSVRMIGAAVSRGRLYEEGEDEHRNPACVALGSFLADQWDGLFAEAKQQGTPWELPMLALLSALNPLVRWAREQS